MFLYIFMLNIIMTLKILKTVSLSQDKIYLPKEIQRMFHYKDKEKLMWALNESGELILIKTELNKYSLINDEEDKEFTDY